MAHIVWVFKNVIVVSQFLRDLLLSQVFSNQVLALFVEELDAAPSLIQLAIADSLSRRALCLLGDLGPQRSHGDANVSIRL